MSLAGRELQIKDLILSCYWYPGVIILSHYNPGTEAFMETPIHSQTSLFEQLGLDSTDSAIETFIDKHRPLASNIELYEATTGMLRKRLF